MPIRFADDLFFIDSKKRFFFLANIKPIEEGKKYANQYGIIRKKSKHNSNFKLCDKFYETRECLIRREIKREKKTQ